ncbi:uncharacterized protein [Rutidosis leptorrhynchoides]|uniref:uncharacterized protein isoform X2 n=1 Tax=Rutidosis leptorrhynchoides TaxID=125765 RepID=UPI003A9929F4
MILLSMYHIALEYLILYVIVVTEFVWWNEEISRRILFSPQPTSKLPSLTPLINSFNIQADRLVTALTGLSEWPPSCPMKHTTRVQFLAMLNYSKRECD